MVVVEYNLRSKVNWIANCIFLIVSICLFMRSVFWHVSPFAGLSQFDLFHYGTNGFWASLALLTSFALAQNARQMLCIWSKTTIDGDLIFQELLGHEAVVDLSQDAIISFLCGGDYRKYANSKTGWVLVIEQTGKVVTLYPPDLKTRIPKHMLPMALRDLWNVFEADGLQKSGNDKSKQKNAKMLIQSEKIASQLPLYRLWFLSVIGALIFDLGLIHPSESSTKISNEYIYLFTVSGMRLWQSSYWHSRDLKNGNLNH